LSQLIFVWLSASLRCVPVFRRPEDRPTSPGRGRPPSAKLPLLDPVHPAAGSGCKIGGPGSVSPHRGEAFVPTISQFFGTTIRMYYRDHAPPHFHAYYAEVSAVVAIDTLEVLEGRLPGRSYRMVLEWAVEHRVELRENWRRAREHLPLEPIAPLK